ncbi:Rrf2 family transcriptional regulator [Streptacidiphilus sp. PB12-B1b]|uniref:RrF2 family transcriptional regulator n=1 Tax=Streptacidiphilus sp. PB12-B1b TaxID=2705012 RepID=UPI0015FE5925|nr:Rrf2 family transcriptional regulator [Streptacidiphilus sp. PB12-B1b]QMU77384.1 Rrf2 family transcriptional regulator [Streptacidiphilus sp. PB12-B1b]
MHISAKADYAVRALLELALDTARPLTCEGIASSQEIPFRFLKAVVGDLRRAGLVRSQRGCEGGYWLGRPAEEISLLDVALAVDGELMTLRGETPAGLAYPGPASGLPGIWRAVEAGARRIMEETSIASLLGGYRPAAAPAPEPSAQPAAERVAV